MTSIGTQVSTMQDRSQAITVTVFQHVSTPAQEHWVEEEVLVGDSEMVAIGGGGIGKDSPEGNLLTASHPNSDLTGWVVSSKDHEIPDPVDLTSFVIGLKIAGLTRQQLFETIQVHQATMAVAAHPESSVKIDPEFVLLGGGFLVNWTGAGNLATGSFPLSSGWMATSKDHDVSDPSSITVFAIGLLRELTVGKRRMRVEATMQESPINMERAAHPSATATLPTGFALCGGGARVEFHGDGSLLWKLQPACGSAGTFTGASKDHIHPDPSKITAFALGIQIFG